MYRLIHPEDRQELPLRMLFHPSAEGLFHRAVEADSYRGLVAALLDDPAYERTTAEERLLARLRLADDSRLLASLWGRELSASDRDGRDVINVASDEPFIRSLDRAGIVSLPSTSGESSSP